MKLFKTSALATAAVAALLSGCSAVGPDFQAPAAPQATSYRHADAQPQAALANHWWALFNDATLNELETRAFDHSPSVQASAQRLLQAEAQLGATRAADAPQFNANAGASYQRASGNSSQAILLHNVSVKGMNYSVGASMSYELDAWGRVRRLVEAGEAQLEAARDDHGGVLLTLSSQIASTYWQLRGLGAQVNILTQALASREETEALVRSRFNAGLSNELDLSRARIESANARSALQDARRQRTNTEHALAVLVGTSPSEPLLPVDAGITLPAPPQIPVGIPAKVLSQRPDLASSVANLRALNAQVGVAEAAFYPSFSLTGGFGYVSQPLSDLFQSNSRQFAVGPLGFSLPLFDGGRNRANLDAAKARYAEGVANHQAKLLTALREVEDALNDVQQLQEQARVQTDAQTAAARAGKVAQARYERGISSYLDVTDAQRSSLAADRDAAQIATQRLLASVAVARALGGGWTADD